jgi:hypothetical protein
VAWDFPTGATIVCTFGGVLVVMFLLHLALKRGHESKAVPSVAAHSFEMRDRA